MTLQEIKDDWAKGIYFRSWSSLNDYEQNCLWPLLLEDVQRECGRLTLEEAKKNGTLIGNHPANRNAIQKVFYPHHDGWEIKLNGDSITDPKNIKIIE